MSTLEAQPVPVPQSLDDYQKLVDRTKRRDFGEEWGDDYAELILDEYLELEAQHGPTLLLFTSTGEDRERLIEEHPELLDGVKEELGDLLWFAVSTASHLGRQASELSELDLTVHGRRHDVPAANWEALAQRISANSPRIQVVDKYTLEWGPKDGRIGTVSLFENPHYVMVRYLTRLTRALMQGRYDGRFLPSASELEPMSDPQIAAGGLINSVLYMAHRLGISAEDLASSNMQKLHDPEYLAKRRKPEELEA